MPEETVSHSFHQVFSCFLYTFQRRIIFLLSIFLKRKQCIHCFCFLLFPRSFFSSFRSFFMCCIICWFFLSCSFRNGLKIAFDYVHLSYKFDVSTAKGIADFNKFIKSRSYVKGLKYSEKDMEYYMKFQSIPNAFTHPHACRWYLHISAIKSQMDIHPPTTKEKVEVTLPSSSSTSITPAAVRKLYIYNSFRSPPLVA